MVAHFHEVWREAASPVYHQSAINHGRGNNTFFGHDPGFWARPRVPGPRFLRPGPWVWALGLGPLGLYCSFCLKYYIKVHTAFFKTAVNRKLLYELQKKYFMKKSLHWVKHTQIGDGGKVRVVKVVKL